MIEQQRPVGEGGAVITSRIDWYSYTVPFEINENMSWFQNLRRAEGALPHYLILSKDQAWGAGMRAGLKASRELGGVGYVHVGAGWILVEHTGKGCAALDSDGTLRRAIQLTSDRATRIDIAVDIRTDVTPEEFAEQRDGARTSSGGVMRSSDGVTVYVGSRSSDRYCRVYRYNPPHPRSEWLRVEYVLKGSYAKMAAGRYGGGESVSQLAAAAGSAYGWTHSVYHAGRIANASPLSVDHMRRDTGRTVMWLYDTVAHSLAKQVQTGTIDLEHFVAHVKGLVK